MKKAYILIFIFFGLIAQAQVFKKSETHNDLKLSSLPYYSYGKGLGMTSADSIFQLNIRFRMQNRITYMEKEGEEGAYDAQIRRLRLRFDGYVGNPHFLYVIQLSFAPGDVGEIEEGKNINIIRDAALIYRPNDNWSFTFGQTKLPGNRQRVNSSGALQLTDRSINNAKFNLDRDFGIQAYYLQEHKDAFSYNIKTAISSGQGRNWTGNNTNVALTGKLELLPFGTFSKDGSYFEGDLIREQDPKLMLSGTYHQNNNANLSQGQLGEQLFEARRFNALLLDGILKYNGWAAMLSYMNRMTDDPITNGVDSNGAAASNYVFAGHGMDYQLSYLFPNNYELIGRYSMQKVQDELFDRNVPNTNQYSIGVTKYLWEHAFKIQTELTFDELRYQSGNQKNNWYLRVQFEIGI
ncbi:porin [Flavobacterium sp. JP2137]|uniref:porin n=1 Tax=Flavobacterium sp. JP2137 TaxID=3414510 RepID=UPI003D2FF4C1